MTDNQPQLGAWDKLPTEDSERKPKVKFDLNVPVKVRFINSEPREFNGEKGAYYLFDVLGEGGEEVILTSAWTLLYELKKRSPLAGKSVVITKKLVNGKQGFEVKDI